MSKPLNEYKYFDTPDGEDTFKKLWAATKISGAASLAIATGDVFLFSHPKGYLKTLGRYAYICLPIVGMTATFVMVKNFSTGIRDKDDKLNWVLGACSAGLITGAWMKSTQVGFAACASFSLAAMLKKHALQNGWTLFNHDVKQRMGGIRSVRQDFTLTKHRPGNWTTGE